MIYLTLMKRLSQAFYEISIKARRVEANASFPLYHANGLGRFGMIVLPFFDRSQPMKPAHAVQST
jgi:hypothetical protein